jgi:hypothetical protein
MIFFRSLDQLVGKVVAPINISAGLALAVANLRSDSDAPVTASKLVHRSVFIPSFSSHLDKLIVKGGFIGFSVVLG